MYFLHPREWRPEDGGDALPFPCILKTRRKMYVPGMAKAYRLRNRAELEETLRRLSSLPGLSPEHMLIQQWVPGGDDRVIFCMQYYDRHGNRPISFVGRKIRQWPPDIGGTCSAIASPDPVAERESTSFFESVRMRGICSMEFKRSEDDNKLYMIEPTVCRADYQEGTATANGFNLPYALYCAECDLKPYTPAPRARAAVWVHVGPDFRSAMQTAGPSWRARWNWWRSLRGRKAFAVFHASAPGPFLELIRRKAVSRMRRILPRL
jgi:predicted ATP-grasp superfamily ATP-dependent carboligase